MARRYRKTSFNYSSKGKKGGEGICLILAFAIGALILLMKMILFIAPIIAIGVSIYYYSIWQKKRLEHYQGNWSEFYHSELKYKLQNGIAICMTITGFVLLPTRTITGLMLMVASLFMYVGIDKLIRQKFEKIYNFKTKGAILGVLGLTGLITNFNYQKIEDIKIAQQEEIVVKREKEIELKTANSYSLYRQAKENLTSKNYKKALILLDSSLNFLPNNTQASYSKAIILKETGKYEKALEILQNVSTVEGISNDELYLNKGICFLKLGDKKAAAHELKQSSELGNIEAKTMYNKINPIIKEIIGYVTRCCDGSTSSAKGRGACSHHGGVCNWNDPIYSERRKYDD